FLGGRFGSFELDVIFLLRFFEAFAFSDVASGSEHALQLAVAIMKRSGVVGNHGFLAIAGEGSKFVVGDLVSREHTPDPGFGSFRIGEIVLERGTYQFIAGAPRE